MLGAVNYKIYLKIPEIANNVDTHILPRRFMVQFFLNRFVMVEKNFGITNVFSDSSYF